MHHLFPRIFQTEASIIQRICTNGHQWNIPKSFWFTQTFAVTLPRETSLTGIAMVLTSFPGRVDLRSEIARTPPSAHFSLHVFLDTLPAFPLPRLSDISILFDLYEW